MTTKASRREMEPNDKSELVAPSKKMSDDTNTSTEINLKSRRKATSAEASGAHGIHSPQEQHQQQQPQSTSNAAATAKTSASTTGASTDSSPVKGPGQQHSPSRPPAHYFPPMPHLAYTMAAPPHGAPYYPPRPPQGGWYGGPHQPPPYPPPGSRGVGPYPHYDPSLSEPPPTGYYPPHYPPYGHYPMQHMSSPDKSPPIKSHAERTAAVHTLGDRIAAAAPVRDTSTPNRPTAAAPSAAYPPPQQSSDEHNTNANEESQYDQFVQDVDPMRLDFHFYLKDHKDAVMEQARKKILDMLLVDDTDATEESIDQLLLFTLVNERMKALWEMEPKETRDKYRIIEETDRARFMQEDEIASRHCATLTARAEKKLGCGSSPGKFPASPTSKLDCDEDDSVSDTEDHLLENGGDEDNTIPTTHQKRESGVEEENTSPVKKMKEMTNADDDEDRAPI